MSTSCRVFPQGLSAQVQSRSTSLPRTTLTIIQGTSMLMHDVQAAAYMISALCRSWLASLWATAAVRMHRPLGGSDNSPANQCRERYIHSKIQDPKHPVNIEMHTTCLLSQASYNIPACVWAALDNNWAVPASFRASTVRPQHRGPCQQLRVLTLPRWQRRFTLTSSKAAKTLDVLPLACMVSLSQCAWSNLSCVQAHTRLLWLVRCLACLQLLTNHDILGGNLHGKPALDENAWDCSSLQKSKNLIS